METGRVKRYVQVNADFMPDGTVSPHSVTIDGQEFLIDRVVKVEDTNNSQSSKGRRRFRIEIKGKETSLFLEKERWYVGKKVPAQKT